jgi:hypothetical protein
MLRIVMLSVVMMNHILLSEEAPFFIQIVVVSNMHKKVLFFQIARIVYCIKLYVLVVLYPQ